MEMRNVTHFNIITIKIAVMCGFHIAFFILNYKKAEDADPGGARFFWINLAENCTNKLHKNILNY